MAAFGVAAAAAGSAAWVGAGYVEDVSRQAVETRLRGAGLDWAEVRADGLALTLTGTAPDEPARFRAITSAGAVVDPGRVVDAMEVAARDPIAPPRFSLEILRNGNDVSAIGLVPGAEAATGLDELLARAGGGSRLRVTNMVESADYPVPGAWDPTLRFALDALADLPRSKVSVAPGRVTVTAVADSDAEKVALERRIEGAAPEGVALALEIAAPRPIIAPFTLRFVIPENGAPRFDACAVDDEAARARVMAAAEAAGMTGEARCVIGLGVPSASWGEAAEAGIAALARLGGGALTMSDADVALVAREGADRALFETVVAELDAALPEIFVLASVLPEPAVAEGGEGQAAGTPEFVAALSPEGRVQLRGRLYDAAQEAAVASYGRALFGVAQTYVATREDEALPEGWPVRVLAGLDALSTLESGTVVVQPELVAISGVTGSPTAEADISGLLSDKLGAQADIRIEVTYDEELDPLLGIPTPEECEAELNAILAGQKLSFAPGEAVIEADGDGQIARLEAKLQECSRAVFEIGGHTDSQGREESNLRLSVARAEAVRDALVTRGAFPSQLVAQGYGEARPVADNGSEAGREANRRITFTLLGRRDDEVDAPLVAGRDDVAPPEAGAEAGADEAPVGGEAAADDEAPADEDAPADGDAPADEGGEEPA